MATAKTNAMRLLETRNAEFEVLTYDAGDGQIDGVSVAAKIGRAPETVYKTLVTQGGPAAFFVFVIPVEAELDLKKAARLAGVKSIEMLPVKDLQRVTGYIRGGCSPIGMKRPLPTFIDNSAKGLDRMVVSAGKIGAQLVLRPADLVNAVGARLEELTHGESVHRR